jgi:PBP1b-binding outer membrane lipoprotein LpoB
MKKIITITIVCILALTIIGCSQSTDTINTEEKTREHSAASKIAGNNNVDISKLPPPPNFGES